MATNIVHSIKNDATLVLRPKAKNSPPTASEKAPIHAKNTGNNSKIPPYSATSFGNQATTSKMPKLAVDDQGKPNLSDPKLSVSNSPHTILGMAKNISAIQCFWVTGVIISLIKFKIRVFISEILIPFF